MKRYWNNAKRLFHYSKLLTLCSKLIAKCYKLLASCYKFPANRSKRFACCPMLIALCFIPCWILYPEHASSGPYLGTPPSFSDSSAHGNTSYGVKRIATGFPTDYTRGLCAHCHEQHASIGGAEPAPNTGGAAGPDKYELFSRLFVDQNTMFCFRCHRRTGSLQLSMPLQYNYSNIAGGDAGIFDPNSIRDAFNPPLGGSSHYLDGIRTFLSNQNWGFGSTTSKINPCSGCHNPHRAQRDPHRDNPLGRIGVDGKLAVSSVSRPSQQWDLWGDGNLERMSDYTINYQAPYFYLSKNTYEPDGSNTSDGSNLFGSVTFCLDCHQYQITVNGSTVKAIDWGPNGDQHGKASQACCDWGDVKEPYSKGGTCEDFNYVLSCLDCHEPHGSPNEYLLRSEANGAHTGPSNGFTFSTHQYWYLCSACHTNIITKHSGADIDPDSDCWGCHRHGVSLNMCRCTSAKTF